MSQPEWIRLVPIAQVRPGHARFVGTEAHELAVFHLSQPDRVIVIDNACPHAGGNLSAGSIEGCTVTCPWHHWTFDLDRGRCPDSPRVRLRTYPCRVHDGHVYARLDGGRDA